MARLKGLDEFEKPEFVVRYQNNSKSSVVCGLRNRPVAATANNR
jgi:hypothetical protein